MRTLNTRNILIPFVLLLVILWYGLSAAHIRYYYRADWYSPENHFNKHEAELWATSNWIFSPISTPIYYTWKGVEWLLVKSDELFQPKPTPTFVFQQIIKP